MRALNIAASGLQAQQLNVEVISNNIANINTTAYQRQRAEFQDLLYQNEQRAGTNSSDAGTIVPTGIQLGLGVNAGSVYRVTMQGELTQTNSPTDIAIRGRGYFRVDLPNGGYAYTRAGSFHISPQGEIVTQKGYIVSPGITIPGTAGTISINESGQISATLPGSNSPQVLGQLELYDFVNPAGLQAEGDNLLTETAASGQPVQGLPNSEQFGSMLQGWLETSNVNPVTEITSLITAQRSYELNSKVIQAGDEMLQTVNQSKR